MITVHVLPVIYSGSINLRFVHRMCGSVLKPLEQRDGIILDLFSSQTPSRIACYMFQPISWSSSRRSQTQNQITIASFILGQNEILLSLLYNAY